MEDNGKTSDEDVANILPAQGRAEIQEVFELRRA
jgi:hypothetical protein